MTEELDDARDLYAYVIGLLVRKHGMKIAKERARDVVLAAGFSPQVFAQIGDVRL